VNVVPPRVQFGVTTIYHFVFVPVAIGLAFLGAILPTMWHRSGDPEPRRLVKFFGPMLLINVAIGVVTGLVQEFEFGQPPRWRRPREQTARWPDDPRLPNVASRHPVFTFFRWGLTARRRVR
jgi:hypothetical protein